MKACARWRRPCELHRPSCNGMPATSSGRQRQWLASASSRQNPFDHMTGQHTQPEFASRHQRGLSPVTGLPADRDCAVRIPLRASTASQRQSYMHRQSRLCASPTAPQRLGQIPAAAMVAFVFRQLIAHMQTPLKPAARTKPFPCHHEPLDCSRQSHSSRLQNVQYRNPLRSYA